MVKDDSGAEDDEKKNMATSTVTAISDVFQDLETSPPSSQLMATFDVLQG